MLGCLLYELCALEKPFPGSSMPEIIQKIINDEPIPIPKSYSLFLKKLIVTLLTKDQFKRPDINQIIAFPEIKAETDRITASFQGITKPKINPMQNFLEAKKKTLSKPVSFGNLPTYSTEYNEINSKKTMTPHFIPQEMLKDFEKNSILNLIQQINNSKKVSSPMKRIEKNSIIINEPPQLPPSQQITLVIPQNHEQISFEKYLQQKLFDSKDPEENSLIKIHNFYSSFEEKLEKNPELTNNPPKDSEIQYLEENYKPATFNQISKIDKMIPYSPLSHELSKQKESNPLFQEKESTKNPSKKHFPPFPESNFPTHRLKDLIASHMTTSLTKPMDGGLQNKKKVIFSINENKERGRGKGRALKNVLGSSPKSASVNQRNSDRIGWGEWFLEKVQKSHQLNNLHNPRSILMMDFIKSRNEKENYANNPPVIWEEKRDVDLKNKIF